MLRRMHLKNFKSWEDTEDVDLRPITGIFGTNSSGKTSLIQALLLLKQTVDSRDRGNVFHFGEDTSTPVNLGDFESIVYNHDTNRTIKISIDWKSQSPIMVIDIEKSQIVAQGTDMGFEVTVQETASKSMKSLAIEEMAYRVDNGRFGMRRQRPNKAYELFTEGVQFEFARRQGRPSGSLSPVKYYGFPDSLKAGYTNAEFVVDLEFSLEECLRGTYYLGPVRAYPKRNYAWSGADPTDMGQAGGSVVDAMLASRERGEKIAQGKGRRRLTLEKYVAKWLKDLALIHDFRVVPIAEGSKIFEVKVRKSPKSPEVLITDVGFGVSQILPVLTLCFYVPKGSTVILEQPEIHLHPLAQAGLADVFIDAWKKRNVQILVESHSEHLLQRLQRRVAEQDIKECDISLFFCSPDHGRSKLTSLQLDEYGNIKNWPKDFFGDQFGEIAAMSEAVLLRQMASE